MKKSLFWAIVIVATYLGFSLFGASVLALLPIQQPLDDLQIRVEILKSITEGAAIIIAGVWTYEVYIKNRYDYPYPAIKHSVQYYSLGNGYNYLSVFISVTNEGKTKLDLSGGIIRIRQVLPLSGKIKELIEKSNPDDISQGINIPSIDPADRLFIDQSQRVGWTTLGERTWEKNLRSKIHELEPGQTREVQFDFLFDNVVDVVELISFFEFKRTARWWEYATLHSIKK